VSLVLACESEGKGLVVRRSKQSVEQVVGEEQRAGSITAEVALDRAAEGEGDEVEALRLLGRGAQGLRRQQPRRRLR
jgi:hypothetical protein